MKLSEEEKKAKRRSDSRLRYWANRRLKDLIRRKAQVEEWVDTYDSVLDQKKAKVAKVTVGPRRSQPAQPEVRAA
jgi:hypothetical protein